jgi:hypothetical protein
LLGHQQSQKFIRSTSQQLNNVRNLRELWLHTNYNYTGGSANKTACSTEVHHFNGKANSSTNYTYEGHQNSSCNTQAVWFNGAECGMPQVNKATKRGEMERKVWQQYHYYSEPAAKEGATEVVIPPLQVLSHFCTESNLTLHITPTERGMGLLSVYHAQSLWVALQLCGVVFMRGLLSTTSSSSGNGNGSHSTHNNGDELTYDKTVGDMAPVTALAAQHFATFDVADAHRLDEAGVEARERGEM